MLVSAHLLRKYWFVVLVVCVQLFALLVAVCACVHGSGCVTFSHCHGYV